VYGGCRGDSLSSNVDGEGVVFAATDDFSHLLNDDDIDS